MGLRIIYGRAGSGKSEICFSEIAKLVKEEKNIYIITPEQFSFTAEKKLMNKIDTKSVLNAEIVTLSRLAYRVINEIGENSKTNLTKCGMAMLIYCILSKNKNKLKYLGKTDENIDIIMRAITEFKKHTITINELLNEIEKIEDKYLKTKLEDMNVIYNSFEKQIKDKYIDETDMIAILANNIDKLEFLKKSHIYIDEFAGFTKQEYEVIRKIIQTAKQVTITISSDNLELNTNPDIDIFYSNKQTISKILEIAKSNNLEIEEIINLDKTYRFKTKELKHLEKNIYNIKYTKYEQNVENLAIFLAKNQYLEIENVAKQITKMVRDDKIRYKDISIITKNIDTYSSLVRSIFGKYDIPVFIDEKRELNQNIIVQYVLSILEVLARNFSNESIFNYLKIGFSDIDKQEIFLLENYCDKWGIKQNKWKEDFTKGNKEDENHLIRLNELRKQIIEPLIELKRKINEDKTAFNISKLIYEFLLNQNIEEKIKIKINELEKNNLIDLVQEYKSSYNTVIDILDQIVLIFNEDKLSLDTYKQILKIGLKNSGLGKIPGTQDQVIIGDVERSRSHKVKNVFIIGLNDGVFPSINKDEGFFNDKDRELLKQDGIELAKGTLENLYEDSFNIYKAFSTAEEKLFLSYPSADAEGKSLRPSMLINKIKKMYPKIIEKSDVVKKNYEITNEISTYEELIENIAKLSEKEKIEDVWYYIYNYFKKQETWKIKLNKDIQGLKYTNLPQTISTNKIEKLYGNVLNTSVSQLEKYKACPFSYFLRYGLKIKEKEEFKIHNFDTGSFMHEVIEEFCKNVNLENGKFAKLTKGEQKRHLKEMTDEEIEKTVNKIVDEKIKLPRNYMFTATAKYKMLVKRLKKIITKAMKYIIESLAVSDFTIQDTEVEFGLKAKYKPILLTLENGQKVEIRGKIDRVDTAKSKEGNEYLRIIDYKSSAKNIDLNEVYAGLQIQLLTYMDAICKEEDFIPAGILYFGLIEQIIKADKKISKEEIEEQIRKNFKMKGLILADVNIIKMQDNSLQTGTSKIIPAGITKEGNINQKSTNGVNSEEFKVLQEYIQIIIKQISKEILSGKIDLKPYNKDGETPCKYCEYKSVCGFDTKNKDNKYNYIDKKSKDEIIEKMQKGVKYK